MLESFGHSSLIAVQHRPNAPMTVLPQINLRHLTPPISPPPTHNQDVRTNPHARPRSSQDCRGADYTQLHRARRRDACPKRTHPHAPAQHNTARIHHSSPARLALPHIANPHTNPIATALAVALPRAPLRDPQPLHPRCAQPMDALLHTHRAVQRPHIHIHLEARLACRVCECRCLP